MKAHLIYKTKTGEMRTCCGRPVTVTEGVAKRPCEVPFDQRCQHPGCKGRWPSFYAEAQLELALAA